MDNIGNIVVISIAGIILIPLMGYTCWQKCKSMKRNTQKGKSNDKVIAHTLLHLPMASHSTNAPTDSTPIRGKEDPVTKFTSPSASTYPNFSFTIKSEYKDARRGTIATPHGAIETLAFIFCATKASMRTTTIRDVKDNLAQIILSNTYHLYLKGYDVIKRLGGLLNL